MNCCTRRQKQPQDRPQQKVKRQDLVYYSMEEWNNVLKKPYEHTNTTELHVNFRQNFPVELRSAIWVWVIDHTRLKNIYKKLINIQQNQQILKDIDRSKCSNPQSLKNILQAYANYDTRLGYVQGMNIIATSIYEQIQNEELSFWILNYILNILDYGRSISYKLKVFRMDLLYFRILDKRIKYEVPKVFNKMDSFNIDSQQCFDFQLFTLFQCCRKEFALRILDVFLLEKEQILFTILIKILQLQQNEILSCKCHETLILYLRNDIIEDALDKLDDSQDLLKQLLQII